jgi:formate hydrogenlyase transcriptional activator
MVNFAGAPRRSSGTIGLAAVRRRKRGNAVTTAAAPSETNHWLLQNGPRELESLFRAIVYQPSAPILIADNEGNSRDASVGVCKLLGLPREKIIGRQLEEFTQPAFKPQVSQLWRAFLETGEQAGVLPLVAAEGAVHDVEYIAKKEVLPLRHVVVLRDKTAADSDPPSWVQDYALYLLDCEGSIAAWYAGAARIYDCPADRVIGQNVSMLYPEDDALRVKLLDEFKRAAAEGHMATEAWHIKSDGSRFWANSITLALKDNDGELRGYARAVRDFSGRHDRDEKLRKVLARIRPVPATSTRAGVVSGEFDRIPEANDTFLDMVGYSREDLLAGRLVWPNLTPPEYAPLVELAHEESLRFGACTPFEKELLRKDGTRIPVQVTTAVLKLSPFRWISFVTDLRERDRQENIEGDAAEVTHQFEEFVGSSAPMRRVMGQVEVVAPTDATVLVLGETGTGKELIARAIHRLSPRRKLPFISLNCAAIPTGLLESELFGYERGAFTGALAQKIGRFEMAHRGTLFLDEVGDIPIDLQPKLLRALQEKSFERLGGTRTIPIDVRLVAATNRDLKQMMGDKLFRSDLYYRLKVFPIAPPPLRDHPEDIPLLARHFTKKYAEKMDRKIDKIPAETMKALVGWTWPGNVRELENFIERSVILTQGSSLRAPLSELRDDAPETAGTSLLEDVERDHIVRILRESDGVISAAANRLGIPRTTLNAMMKKLGVSRTDF